MLTVDVLEYDEAIFMNVARSLRRVGLPLRPMGAQGIFFFDHTPLYYYGLSALTLLSGENILLLRLATTLFGLSTIILVYSTVHKQHGPASGCVAALTLALNPFFGLHAFFLRMEVPMSFFVALSLYFTVNGRQQSTQKSFAPAGIAAALAVLTKQFTIIFCFALAIYAVLIGQTWRERLRNFLWTTAPSGLGLAGWMLWAYKLNPKQFLNTMRRWFNSAAGSSSATEGRMNIELLRWMQTLRGDVFTSGMLALLCIAIIIAISTRKKPPKLTLLALLYPAIAVGLSFVISLKEPRHIIATIPVLAVAIGLLVDWGQVFIWLKQSPPRLGLAMLVFGALAWEMSPLQLPSASEWHNIESWWHPRFAYRMFDSDRYYGIIRDTGEYIAANVPSDKLITIVHEGPVLGYYADHNYLFLYTLPLEGIIKALDDADILVVDHPVFVRLSPEEKDTVMQYIDDSFEQLRIVEDSYRRTTIYRHK